MSAPIQKRRDWIDRMEAIETESDFVLLALDHLDRSNQQDPSLIPERFKTARRTARANREGTYLIRVFAEFETGLRLHWSATWSTEPPSRTKDLLDGTAARRRIQSPVLEAAHLIREYRNSLVHEREEEFEPILLVDAVRDLCRFFTFLPPKW